MTSRPYRLPPAARHSGRSRVKVRSAARSTALTAAWEWVFRRHRAAGRQRRVIQGGL